jgi:hypothetical protein
MDYKDICTKREYMKGEEKKVLWFKVGTLKTTDEGKQFIELGIFPNTPFYVFPKKEKQEEGAF